MLPFTNMNTEQKNPGYGTNSAPNSLLEGAYKIATISKCRGTVEDKNTQLLLFIQGDRDALATVYFLMHSQHKLFHGTQAIVGAENTHLF
jgi:hypothetical protein